MRSALDSSGVVGDGQNDDSAALQGLLDSGTATVYLPAPPVHYVISRPLAIHSGQTLVADRNAVIRLADHAHAYMLTNADHEKGNRCITVTGGIWDGNNAHQTCEYHQKGVDKRAPYDPARYLGVLMQFNRVTDLRIAHVTLKDPEAFGFQAANLCRFTIEDITLDYNLLRPNMDGIHLHGECRQGLVRNIKGTPTDNDMVALNADDGSMYEMSRGPISDVVVDGIWSENAYKAVRLLSAGSPIRRIRVSNILGTYRYYAVAFTNHRLHPGEPSTFDDVTIDGVFCSSAGPGVPDACANWNLDRMASIFVETPGVVSNLSLRDYHRTETALAVNDIRLEPGAHVDNIVLDNVNLTSRCPRPIDMLHNCGSIGRLSLMNVRAVAEDGSPGGRIVHNAGSIATLGKFNVSTAGFDSGC